MQFCLKCGRTLAAAASGDQTVVAPSPVTPLAITAQQRQTILQRAQAAFGSGPVGMGSGQSECGRSDRREHTFLVNDVSGSMSSPFDGAVSKEEAVIRATVTMVIQKAQIDPNDEIGIVTFNSHAQLVLPLCPLHSHKQQIISALQSMTPSNGTDINEGLKAARDAFDWSRDDVVRRIVLLTDGQGGYPLRTAEELKSRGVVIDVIGVGASPSDVDEKLLRQVASVVEGELRFRFLADQRTLLIHYTQIANKTAIARP